MDRVVMIESVSRVDATQSEPISYVLIRFDSFRMLFFVCKSIFFAMNYFEGLTREIHLFFCIERLWHGQPKTASFFVKQKTKTKKIPNPQIPPLHKAKQLVKETIMLKYG